MTSSACILGGKIDIKHFIETLMTYEVQNTTNEEGGGET